jgi:hypothetical protein
MATDYGSFTPLQIEVADAIMQRLIRLPEKKQAMEVLATLSAAFLADVPREMMASWLAHVAQIVVDGDGAPR